MDLMREIPGRRSVRTFDGCPEAAAREVLRFARETENPWGIGIEWRLLDAKEHGLSSPVILGTDTYLAAKLHLVRGGEEALGFVFERAVLYAASLGLGTTWIAGTMNRAAFERAMEVGKGEFMPCVTPLGTPAAKMSLRETMMRKGIRADSRQPFETLFFRDGFSSPLPEEEAGALREPLELVRRGPSAVNRQPWRVVVTPGAAYFYEKRARGGADDPWDVQKVDLGIALCHFALGLEARGAAPELLTEDPGLPCPEGVRFVAGWRLG